MGTGNLSRRTGLIVLGSILIVTGVIIPFLYYYTYYNFLTGQVSSYDFPLLPYGVAVAFLGVIVVIIGVAIKDEPVISSAPQGSPLPPPPTLKRYCRFCGSENKSDAIFCEKCGKQIT